MIWLLLSILCSTAIFVVFKYFGRFGIDNLQAIVVNYFIAFIVGIITGDFSLDIASLPSRPWFYSIFILGFIFISLFQLMAYVSQKFGVAAVSVAVKMSLVIPVVFSVWRYGDSLGPVKIIGIIIAVMAVYLGTRKERLKDQKITLNLLPFILFIGSGFLDAFLKYNQHELVPAGEQAYFSSMLFGTAGFFGLFFILAKALKGNREYRWKNLWGGIALGIPNYGSIYFLLKALHTDKWQGSEVFPINNVGIVLLSVVLAKLIFNEKINRANRMGITLAVVSILLIAYSNFD